MTERYLFISDLQIPFEAPDALKFCKAVVKEFKIPFTNIYNVGDEVDQYFGGLWEKDPDALHTPNSELYESKQRLLKWYREFPNMKLAISNHGLRWAKRAFKAGIPSQMIKPYQDLIEAPKGWVWKEEWTIKAANAEIVMIHGLGFGGVHAHRQAAIDYGKNVVMGHLHANAGVAWVSTKGKSCWGLATGCLVDVDAYAFTYGKYNRNKPALGVGVVIDGGLTPIFVPYEVFR